MQSGDVDSNADTAEELERGMVVKCSRKRKNGCVPEKEPANHTNDRESAGNFGENSYPTMDTQTDDENRSSEHDRKVARLDDSQTGDNPECFIETDAKRRKDSDAERHDDETSSADRHDEATSSDKRDEEGDSNGDRSRRLSNRICLVCGDRASGFNFNILSCESCKAFFRRNALKQNIGTCLFAGDCKIEVHTRRFCAVCRLAKCLRMGMKRAMILDDDAKEKRRTKVLENRVRRARTGDKNVSSDCVNVASGCSNSRQDENVSCASRDDLQNEPNQSQAPLAVGPMNPGTTLHAVAQYQPFMGAISIPIHVPVSALTNLPISINLTGQNLQTFNSVALGNQPMASSVPVGLSLSTLPRGPSSSGDLDVNNSHQSPKKVNGLGSKAGGSATDSKSFDEQTREPDAAPLLMTVASLDVRTTFVYVAQPTANEQPDVVMSSGTADFATLDNGPPMRAPASLNVSGSLTVPAMNLEAAGGRRCAASMDAEELRRRMNRRVLTHEEWKFVSYLCTFYEEAFISDQQWDEVPHPNTTLNALVNVAGSMVRKLIRFAKRIVDFQALRQESQIALLKGGVVNTVYLRSAFHYDAATDSWSTPHGRIRADILKQALRSSGGNATGVPVNTERAFCDSDTVYEEHCQFARSLKPLLDNDLNIVTLLQLIVLFSPDRPSILQTYLPKSALLCPFRLQPTSSNCAAQMNSVISAAAASLSLQPSSARLNAMLQPNLTLNVTEENRLELTEAVYTTTSEQLHIANIQDKFVVLLKHYLEAKYSFSRSRTLFVRIMQKLDELNELTEMHGRVLLFADPSKIEPLMLEVLDLLVSR